MTNNSKIAVLLPTRYRPSIFKRMLESWKSNSVQSDLIVGLQKDDEALDEYKNILAKEPAVLDKVVFLNDIGLAAKYNELYRQYPDYEAYVLLNDDHIFRTPLWDNMIMDRLESLARISGHRLYIMSWKDGWMDDLMPAGFCTRELLEVIKTPCPEGYISHVFIDNVYQVLAGLADIGHYMPEIHIEHMHMEKGKAVSDKNYIGHNKPFIYDYEGYIKWLNEKCEDIVTEIVIRKRLAHNNMSFTRSPIACLTNV